MLKGTRVIMDTEAAIFVAAIDSMRRCVHLRRIL